MWAFLLSIYKQKPKVVISVLGFILLLMILIYLSASWGIKNKKEGTRYRNALYDKQVHYEDNFGNVVTEINQLKVTNRELRDVIKKDSVNLSEYEKRLLLIKRELDANNRNLRKTQTALYFTEETRDSFALLLRNYVIFNTDDGMSFMVDSSYMVTESELGGSLPLKVGRWENDWTVQDFMYDPNNDSLFVVQVSENAFFIDLFKERELNKKDKKVFWPVRWTKPWEYKASIKSKRDSTTIKDAVVVNLTKK